MSQAAEYINHLFDDTTDGYIQVAQLDNNKKFKICRYVGKNHIAEIIEEFLGENDTYITPNTMYKYERKVSNIRQFRALYIDLDIDKNDVYSKSETRFFINQMVNDEIIPNPSMLVDSGRGLHVYWKIKDAPYQALNTWQELEDFLYYKLKPYGADKKATDGARILRLPGTINSKTNTECKVIWNYDDVIYSMYDLREKYLNYKPKISQDKKGTHRNNIVNLFNSYTLHIGRISDIETLCKLRDYNVKGYRNMIIHCYAYWKGIYIRDLERLEVEVKALNDLFKEPLKESEVKAILRCVPKAIDKFISYEQGLRCGERKRVSKGMRDKEGYWYKNETLIDRLDITPTEQRELNTIIGKEEKYRRNNKRRCNNRRNEEGLTQREQQKKDLINKIKSLKLQGMKQREIAENLNISKGTVSKYLKL